MSDAVNEVERDSFNGGDVVVLARNTPINDINSSRCLGSVAVLLLEQDVQASTVGSSAVEERVVTAFTQYSEMI